MTRTLFISREKDQWGEEFYYNYQRQENLRHGRGLFTTDGEIVSAGTAIFRATKHFDFLDSQLEAVNDGAEIGVHASAFARQVWVEVDDPDMLLSDNAFDMSAGERRIRSLRVCGVYDLGK